jgi:hypothetical protein
VSASIHLVTCDNIKKTICQPYDDAYDLLSKLDVYIALKKAKTTEMLQGPPLYELSLIENLKRSPTMMMNPIYLIIMNQAINSDRISILQRTQMMIVHVMMKLKMCLQFQLVVNLSFME